MTKLEIECLELAGKFCRDDYTIEHIEVLKKLEKEGLVVVHNTKDDEGELDGKGSFYGLTENGCKALVEAGGTEYETGACFWCDTEYAYDNKDNDGNFDWWGSTCPVCGFYQADE